MPRNQSAIDFRARVTDSWTHRPMITVPPAAVPTDPRQRTDALDILRGAALLGMLIVHFHDRSSDPGGIDDVVRTVIWRLIESKSHGTFALLSRGCGRGIPGAQCACR